jgi:hypothetical protein
MSCHSTMSRPYAIWRRIDESHDTIASLLHNNVESPCTVACPLCVINRPALYCRRPAVSISCTHLILFIHIVWLVLNTFNTMPTLRVWWGHDKSDARRLMNTWARLEGWESCGMWRRQNPPTSRGESGAVRHVMILESFSTGWQTRCHKACGDVRAFPHREVGMEL